MRNQRTQLARIRQKLTKKLGRGYRPIPKELVEKLVTNHSKEKS